MDSIHSCLVHNGMVIDVGWWLKTHKYIYSSIEKNSISVQIQQYQLSLSFSSAEINQKIEYS